MHPCVARETTTAQKHFFCHDVGSTPWQHLWGGSARRSDVGLRLPAASPQQERTGGPRHEPRMAPVPAPHSATSDGDRADDYVRVTSRWLSFGIVVLKRDTAALCGKTLNISVLFSDLENILWGSSTCFPVLKVFYAFWNYSIQHVLMDVSSPTPLLIVTVLCFVM
jgi:hypothetical protein